MTCRRAAACVAGCLLYGCAAAPAGAAADREVARLDAQQPAPVVLAGGAKPTEVRLGFELPAGAKQGPDQWYVVRLHYRLHLARRSGNGLAWVTSETNGRTSAQIEYTTTRRAGRLAVRRTTVDLLHGQRERRSHSLDDTLTFTNYLQNAGVLPGVNTWTIRLEQSGGARVERLEVLGDTAIVATDRTPFPLAMTVALEGDPPEVGKRFTLTGTLAARPGRTVENVVVRARPQDGLEVIGPATQRVGRVASTPRVVRFTFRARRAGNHPIMLEADSSANHPNAGVQVRVLPASQTRTSAVVWLLASLPALAMTGWLVRSARRRRRTPH